MKKVFGVIILAVLFCSSVCIAGEVGFYNFKTRSYEFVDINVINDFSPYIPQWDSAQAIYQIYLYMGKKPMEAALKTLLDVEEAYEVWRYQILEP